MKNVIIMCMCVIGIMLSGCSASQRTVAMGTVDVVSKASVLKGQYEIVYQIMEKHKGDFSQEEISEFANIDNNARTVYTKIQQLMDLEKFDITPSEIEYLYNVSKNSYISAKTIIGKHEKDFTINELTQLRMFDVQLIAMDESVKKLLENPDTMDTRSTLLTIISVASLSLKVILPLII